MGAPANPSEPLVSLYDYEAAAKRKLSIPAWEYFNGGSGDEITLRRNRSALDALQLKPRVMVDVTRIDTSRTLLGHFIEHPIVLAPTSSHLLAHPEASDLWEMEGWLSERWRLIDSTFDFRYSVLPLVFATLIRDRRLSKDDLRGLAQEKLDAIRHMVDT